MPAPVDSRRSFTIAAVIVVIVAILCLWERSRRGQSHATSTASNSID
jgi:ABC-type Fe3+ transport system permease subunit